VGPDVNLPDVGGGKGAATSIHRAFEGLFAFGPTERTGKQKNV